MFQKLLAKKGQLLSYAMVGFLSTVIDIGGYWVLINIFNIWYIYAQSIIGVLALVFNFSAHKSFTFNSKGSRRKEIPRYIMLVIFNYLTGLAILYILVDVIGLNYMISKLMSVGFIALYNFFLLERFVYRKK